MVNAVPKGVSYQTINIRDYGIFGMGEFGSHDPSVYILITFLIKEREKERMRK